MDKLRIGFIGAGRHAKANIYPSLKVLGVPLVSICTNHLEKAQMAAMQYGDVPSAYDNHLKMLEKENLDAVFIVLPEQFHAGIVESCLNAGVHVFVEKPLGLSTEEATNVANKSTQTGKHVMVGFQKRFAPTYVEAKRVMSDNAKFGDALSLTGMFGVRAFGSEEFFIKNAAIHIIDLIRFFFGDVSDIVGYNNTKGENVDILFSFACKNGQIGNMFFAGLPAWSRHYEEVTITGSQGFIKVENMRKVTYHLVDKDYKPPAPKWQLVDEQDSVLTSMDASGSGGWKDLYQNGYVGEIQHFLDSIANGKSPSPSAIDNINTMEFCEKLLKSIRVIKV